MQRPDQTGNSATFDSPANHGARSDLATARHASAPDAVAGFDGSGHPGAAPAATHWTRILHVDFLNGSDGRDAAGPDDAAAWGAEAEDVRSADDAERGDVRAAPALPPSAAPDAVQRNSSVPAGAILLAFCMVLYLAILGTEHLVSPSAGAALEQAVRSTYEAADHGAAVGVGQWPQGAAFDDDTEQPPGGHEGASRAATTSPSLHD